MQFNYSFWILVAATIQIFTVCGLNFVFGVYQELYETMGGPFEVISSAQIDLIGTIANSLMSLGAPVVSLIARKYQPRNAILIGAVCCGLGCIFASISTKYWQFVLTQGVLFGIGACFSYISAVTVSPGWFDGNRALAMGIILSGTGLGGLVWAPVIRALNSAIGFRNTLRFEGIICFVLVGSTGWLFKWDAATARAIEVESHDSQFRIPMVNWKIATSADFVSQALAGAFQAAAYYSPMFYMSSYSRSLGYSPAMGANIIAISHGSNLIGKVILGYIADRQGRMNMLVVTTILCLASIWGMWLPSTLSSSLPVQRGLIISFAVLFGIFGGAYIALFPTVLAESFGVQNFRSVNSLLYLLRGIGAFVGTPLAGVMISGTNPALRKPVAFLHTTIFIGGLVSVTAISLVWSRVLVGLKNNWKLRV